MEKPPILERMELTKVNDAMPPEAKYGDVFLAIATAQRDADVAYFQDRIDLMQAMLNDKGVAIIDLKSLLEMAKGKIEQARREFYDEGYAKAVKDNQGIIGQRENFWRAQVKDEIKQAKAEVAREIFEEIEDNWEIYKEEGYPPQFRFNYNKYQSLKSKYTGGQVPFEVREDIGERLGQEVMLDHHLQLPKGEE